MLNLHYVLICLSSLYPCYSTSLSVLALSLLFDLALCPRSAILVSSSLQGRLSSLLLISLRPSFYPCFRPRYKDASRPSFLTSNCFRPIPTHIFFHEQYSAEGWPSLASVDQGRPEKQDMHAALLLRNARTRSCATSPLRKPKDSRSASQWLTGQLGKRRSCLWYKNTCLTRNGRIRD